MVNNAIVEVGDDKESYSFGGEPLLFVRAIENDYVVFAGKESNQLYFTEVTHQILRGKKSPCFFRIIAIVSHKDDRFDVRTVREISAK
jgi:hypothetical protein